MLHIVVGDNAILSANIRETGYSVGTVGTAVVEVRDGYGSLVRSGTATYASDGTFNLSVSTSGWNLGPVTEQWRFNNAYGTFTKVWSNRSRVTGTSTLTPYIYPEELAAYYENITDYFDGSEYTQVMNACADVNTRLEALGYKLPFKPSRDGFYDQPLRDLNAYEAIFRILAKRQSSFTRDGEESPWFYNFRELSGSVYQKIKNKTYSFARDYSPADGGIGIPEKTVGTSYAQMETNWRGGVGNGFDDSTFERDWVVQVIGTGTAGGFCETTFNWSCDGGLTYNGTQNTAYDWQGLGYGVYVRFTRGTFTGTNGIFQTGDKWTFKTAPRAQTTGGKRVARSY